MPVLKRKYTPLGGSPDATGKGRRRTAMNDPRSRANVFSLLTLWWQDPLFWLGCHRPLELSDMYAHSQEMDSELLLKKFTRYWGQEMLQKNSGKSPRLWMAIWKCLWWQIPLIILMGNIKVALQMVQSVLVGLLSTYFTYDDPSSEQTRNAYLYAAGLVVAPLLAMFFLTHSNLLGEKAGMITSIITTGAVYQKALRLSQASVGKLTVGHIVALAANDTRRFDRAFARVHNAWSLPIVLLVFTVLEYRLVQWSALVATAAVILMIPVQLLCALLFTKFSFIAARVTDKRVKIVKEVIEGIRVIKMYAWEFAFGRLLTSIRRKEVRWLLRSMLLLLYTIGLWDILRPVVLFGIIATHVVSGGELDTEISFSTISLSLFLAAQINLAITGILELADGVVALMRISSFLAMEELPVRNAMLAYVTPDDKSERSPSVSPTLLSEESSEHVNLLDPGVTGLAEPHPARFDHTIMNDTPSIVASNMSASWANDSSKLVLQNISLELNSDHRLLAVVGPVGAGKSSLLQCLIGELELLEGSVQVCGKMSYASQQPWIFSGTLRENVLFGLPFRREWFQTVVTACALDKDIDLLVHGDQTLIGERGVTLSGGQKARVNLARAVYHESDIYIFDSPLGAVDAPVARHIFENVICGLLSDKLVVLVTHQLQYAERAEKILAIENGCVKAYSSHEELRSQGVDLYRLLQMKEGEEFAVKDEPGEVQNEEEEEEEEEEELISQEWEMATVSNSTCTTRTSAHTSRKQEALEGNVSLPPEEKATGVIPLSTYYHYFRAGGSPFVLFLIAALIVGSQVTKMMHEVWLAEWTDCSEVEESVFFLTGDRTCRVSTGQRIGIYASIAGVYAILRVIIFACAATICLRASEVLHNQMVSGIMRAPVRFFDINPAGRILNRFSLDIRFSDLVLPLQMIVFVIYLVDFLLGVVVATLANFVLLVPAIVLVLFLLILRWYYLRTSVVIQRLEAIARSPIFSHFANTLHGLPTIRTSGMEAIALQQFHDYKNQHTRPYATYVYGSAWFSIRIQALCILFTVAVAFASIPMASVLDPGLVGLGLAYAITLSAVLQICFRMNSDIENYMVSVERIMEYSKLQPEASLHTLPPHTNPPPQWPDRGGIELQEVSLRYANDLPVVLNSLSFSTKPGEKVGIVGRTGAGKSSIMAVLFRMTEPEGRVMIDGINTLEIGLHDLREKISIIPQDPVLFSGTLRYNLDPFHEYSDQDIWSALEQVQLKEVLESSELFEGGLSGVVSEGGSNFSVGQRQLVCLARALLRKNKILVLDEATANVDMKTDAIIQQAIREQFAHCTVLTIAHRLNTIMDSDRVLVMSKGKAKEFDSPYTLLQNPKSLFKRMVDQTEPAASEKLYQMALEAHSRKQETPMTLQLL